MILVTGATGHFGNAVINHLLKNIPASEIAALVRNEAKATDLKAKGVDIRIGQYDDIASIEKAVQGIEKLLLVSGLDMNRGEQHENLINAAKKAGVKHIAYTSVTLKDWDTSSNKMLMDSHRQTEEYLKASGINYTLLQNTLYIEAIPNFVGQHVLENGIFLPAGTGKTPFALRDEMAEAAANVLLNDGHENKSYQITNTESYSFEEVAQSLSELSGKSVTYTSPEPKVFEEQLKKIGLNEVVIAISAGFAADIRNGDLDIVSSDLENLLGRKPTTLKEGLKQVFHL
jgi:NAD(P)H dehydrogenase (quinone)